jgi:hypothetical protein
MVGQEPWWKLNVSKQWAMQCGDCLALSDLTGVMAIPTKLVSTCGNYFPRSLKSILASECLTQYAFIYQGWVRGRYWTRSRHFRVIFYWTQKIMPTFT